MKRTNIHVPEPLRKAFHALAKKQDVSAAELYRRAMIEFVRRETKVK